MENSHLLQGLSQYKGNHVMGLVPAQLGCGNVKYTYELSVKLWVV